MINNIIWTQADGRYLALTNSAGVINMRNNWLKQGWVNSHSGLTGQINDDGATLTGDDPGFIDIETMELHLNSSSPCIDAGGQLPDIIQENYPLLYQYLKHRNGEVRPVDETIDIGAFEYGTNWPIDEAGWLETVPESIEQEIEPGQMDEIIEIIEPAYADGEQEPEQKPAETQPRGCNCTIII